MPTTAAAGVGPLGLVSRATNLLDAFAAGADGFVYTAAWQPGWTEFHGWSRVGGLQVAPCSPISAVSRSTNKLDIFAAGLDGRAYTAAWKPGDKSFRGWWQVGNLVTTPHAWITSVSRSADKLDVFAVGLDGGIYTAAWQPGWTEFHGWWRIGDLTTTPGSQVSAVSRSTDKLDIFVTANDGYVYTAAWKPGDTVWRGWWKVAGGQAAPGSPVGAVSRSTDRLDVFVAGNDGHVYTAAWQPGDTDWRGWGRVGALTVPRRAAITAVSRSVNKMDVFATGTDGHIYTAAWQPGDMAFRGWWGVAGGVTLPGAQVACESRASNLLDVISVGTDARVYAAAWQPGWTEFHGWWPVSDLLTGMSDPGVSQWTQTGTTFQSENTDHSEEAQGMATDGSAWFLVSNGEKTLRKRVGNGWAGTIPIPQGVAGGHVGAPGCYDGWVYVPVQGPHGVWKIRTNLSSPQWFPIDNGGQDILPWCSVNPLNGRLYTSLYPAPKSLIAYDRLTLKRCPEDDIALGSSPMHLDRVQGGVFTPNGRVILVRWDYNAVLCYSVLTGHCLGAKAISGMVEIESVAVRDWVYSNGAVAKVHILDLDNDWPSKDDCYLRGFSVPHPHLL